MRTAASGREASVATSLTRARDANARQRAAFQRFTRDAMTSHEFSGRSSIGTTGRASTTTRAAPKGTNTFIESFFDLADVVVLAPVAAAAAGVFVFVVFVVVFVAARPPPRFRVADDARH